MKIRHTKSSVAEAALYTAFATAAAVILTGCDAEPKRPDHPAAAVIVGMLDAGRGPK